MIKQHIGISCDDIIKNYKNINDLFSNIIHALYGKEYNKSLFELDCFNSEDFINPNGSNTLGKLDSYKNKTGVYIFLDKVNIPVYIGLAGKIGGHHSIKDRLGVQLKCDRSNATLIKNILTVNALLQGTEYQANLKTHEKKKLIIEYAPKIIVISLGLLEDNNKVRNAIAIEGFLIAIFNSKYNK